MTDGATKTPFVRKMRDIDRVEGVLPLHGQVADLGGSASRAKVLYDVVGTLVKDMGYEVLFRRNKTGGLGHCLIAPVKDAGQVFPVNLNSDRLPCAPTEEADVAFPSEPDSLWDLVQHYTELARARDRRLGLVRQRASQALASAFAPDFYDRRHGASETPSDELDSGSVSSAESSSEEQARRQLRKAVAALSRSKRVGRKSRRRTHGSGAHNGESAHRVLHRSADLNHKTFSQPGGVVEKNGKAVPGSQASVHDFEYKPCSVCKMVRSVAPVRHNCSMCLGCLALAARE